MPLTPENQPAPAFELTDQQGNLVRLADFVGQYVVIYFYPKALTSGCTVQACGIRDAKAALAQRGITVLAISPDTPDRLSKFEEKEELNFILLSDSEHRAADAYGTWQEKSMYGRRYMGMSRSSFFVDKQGVMVKSWPKVTPGEHASMILKWFDQTFQKG